MYLTLLKIWGMGFIENNKADCMTSVLINTNLLEHQTKKYKNIYFHLVHVFIMHQNKVIQTILH